MKYPKECVIISRQLSPDKLVEIVDIDDSGFTWRYVEDEEVGGIVKRSFEYLVLFEGADKYRPLTPAAEEMLAIARERASGSPR